MRLAYPPTPKTIGLAAQAHAMYKEGKNKAQIARELGKSKAYIGALVDWYENFKGEAK